LSDWAKSGWLVEHKTTPQEIESILAVGDRNLSDSRAPGLSEDGQFGMAYNAAVSAAVAALAAAGYRAPKESHHYRVIQSLALTIGLDRDSVERMDSFRKKRNISMYERAGIISGQEVREITTLAQRLRHDVERWLRETHPDLLRG